MTVTITEDKDISFDGLNPRRFKTGEVYANLRPEDEQTLIDGGWAKNGGKEKDAVENTTEPAPLTPIQEANKVSKAPQAVDTAAVAARVVNDGVTHDSEGGATPGSSNSEGPEVAHATDLLGGQKDADPVSETKSTK